MSDTRASSRADLALRACVPAVLALCVAAWAPIPVGWTLEPGDRYLLHLHQRPDGSGRLVNVRRGTGRDVAYFFSINAPAATAPPAALAAMRDPRIWFIGTADGGGELLGGAVCWDARYARMTTTMQPSGWQYFRELSVDVWVTAVAAWAAAAAALAVSPRARAAAAWWLSLLGQGRPLRAGRRRRGFPVVTRPGDAGGGG